MARMTKEERTRQIYIRVCLSLGLIAIGLTVLYFVLSNMSKTQIDLNEKTHLVITGFNGEGEMSATIDNDDTYGAFYETVSVSFSKSTGLSNGDVVDITYAYDKKLAKRYNLKVKASDMHYTVKDLVDPVALSENEIFDGVDVLFDGIAPLVEAKIQVKKRPINDAVSYVILDEKQYYDLGDTVKVQAVYSDEELALLDYVPDVPCEECIKEFTVEGMDRYITDSDEITEDMVASFKKEALSLFTDANEYGMRIFCDAGLMPVYINKKTTFVWSSPSYISSYLNVLKEECYGETGKHVNDLKLCFESVISQADGTACRAEVVVMYENIILRADGTVDLNLESGEIISADRRDSHIKALINNKLDDDYESEKIEFI